MSPRPGRALFILFGLRKECPDHRLDGLVHDRWHEQAAQLGYTICGPSLTQCTHLLCIGHRGFFVDHGPMILLAWLRATHYTKHIELNTSPDSLQMNKTSNRQIYCCGCGHDVGARLTDGSEIYPHRHDLRGLPFWRCDACGNFVGCHHKTRDRTRPLGCIPTPEISARRKRLHALFDPAWRDGRIGRKELYAAISKAIGREYHTGEIRSIEEADQVLAAATRALRAAQSHPH